MASFVCSESHVRVQRIFLRSTVRAFRCCSDFIQITNYIIHTCSFQFCCLLFSFQIHVFNLVAALLSLTYFKFYVHKIINFVI